MIDILVKIETNTKIEIEVDSNNNVDVNTIGYINVGGIILVV